MVKILVMTVLDFKRQSRYGFILCDILTVEKAWKETISPTKESEPEI